MNKQVVKIKKTDKNAAVPSYGTQFSAGADIYALADSDVVIPAGKSALIHTGIALEIPTGFVGLVCARSGLASREGLAPANKVGVIDSDYRGELMVALHNHSDEDRTVENGERIAQLLIVPYMQAVFEECDELEDTSRGAGGFGSTGKK